jgi:hypothetical protein
VVHIEKAEGTVKPDLGFGQSFEILALRALGNDGTDDRRNGQADEKKDGEFQGTEKIPDLLGDSAILCCQGILLKICGVLRNIREYIRVAGQKSIP